MDPGDGFPKVVVKVLAHHLLISPRSATSLRPESITQVISTQNTLNPLNTLSTSNSGDGCV